MCDRLDNVSHTEVAWPFFTLVMGTLHLLSWRPCHTCPSVSGGGAAGAQGSQQPVGVPPCSSHSFTHWGSWEDGLWSEKAVWPEPRCPGFQPLDQIKSLSLSFQICNNRDDDASFDGSSVFIWELCQILAIFPQPVP